MIHGETAAVLVLGAGNLLCSDDGVGVHAVRTLAARGGLAGAVVVDVGTAVFHAASLADGARDLVVIDAVCAGDAPGTVYTFDGYAAEESGRFRSLHSLGLRSALHLLPAGHRPSTFQVVGVEPESLAYGMELTPRVQAALPRVIDEVRHAVQQTK